MQSSPSFPAKFDAGFSVEHEASCELPTPWGVFQLHAFRDPGTNKEHLALTLGDISDGQPVLTRIHSECLTGDTLFSQRCDCGAQLETALRRIAEAKRGILLYLRQEGRGIGLFNKIRAYALQDAGADTVEANRLLGFADDARDYSICRPMLEHFGIAGLMLMTNNPKKVEAMKQMGFPSVERIALVVPQNRFNKRYLATKVRRLGHQIPLEDVEKESALPGPAPVDKIADIDTPLSC
jgi:GTP cyclohydrolase II